MKIPFSPPYIDDAVIEEVTDTLRSGWITTGPKVKLLEESICQLTGLENCVAVNSATSGLMLLLKWFGVGPGDEVIVPAYTYCTTALAVIHVGATPILVDVAEDFNISVSAIKQKINKNTKAIISVDFAGWPVDYQEILELCLSESSCFNPQSKEQEKLGRILFISDAAHALGATYKGKSIASFADATVFSFHAVKNITTAEGGMVCLNFPEAFNSGKLYQHLRTYTLNGQTKDAFTKSKAGGWKYDILFAGMKINMPDVSAAIGLAQIRHYQNDLLPKRKAIFQRYQQGFSTEQWAINPQLDSEHKIGSAHLYPLRIRGISELQRDQIIDKITEKEIAVNVHFRPLPELTLFKDLGWDIHDFPMAYSLYQNEISLPIYSQLTYDEVDFVITEVTAVVNALT
jgi:dTDP-4-amino-4,6-dideoxygalactose transaminase